MDSQEINAYVSALARHHGYLSGELKNLELDVAALDEKIARAEKSLIWELAAVLMTCLFVALTAAAMLTTRPSPDPAPPRLGTGSAPAAPSSPASAAPSTNSG